MDFPAWLMEEITDLLSEWNDAFTDIDWDVASTTDGRLVITVTLEFEEEDEDGGL